MRTVVVVGNPKPRSRTREAAEHVATALSGGPPDAVIDVIDLGAGLLGWDDPAVAAAVETACSSDLLVVASPTYKATYTGLVKLFLDQIGPDGLTGVIAVPLMLGAGPAHALAPELTLRPVLTELGASCPLPGLYLLDRTWSEDPALATWLAKAHSVLGGVRA